MQPTVDCSSSSSKTIATHSGTFHCDEVLAVYMLSQHTKEFRNAKVVRSRDKTVYSSADIVVDVGGEFDLKRNRFDHHQRGFSEQLADKYETRLSSAGLIFKYFGKEVVRDIIENAPRPHTGHSAHDDMKMTPLTDDELDAVYGQVYESLIESVDAIDNGIKQYDTDKPARYLVRTDLGSRVAALNPLWNEAASADFVAQQFEKAVRLTGEALVGSVLRAYKSWLPARKMVQVALQERFKVHPSGQILKFKSYCPWVEHFYQLHATKPIEPLPLYALFGDTAQWKIRAVPDEVGSFGLLKALPEPWRGKEGQELSECCGVEGSVFVHRNGFIAINQTLAGALKMADLAVKYGAPK